MRNNFNFKERIIMKCINESNCIRSSAEGEMDFELLGDELVGVRVKPALSKFINPFSNGRVYENDNYPLVCCAVNGVFVATNPVWEGDEMWEELENPEEVPGYIWKNPVTGIKGQDLAIELAREFESFNSRFEDVHSKATFKVADKLLTSLGFTLAGTFDENIIDFD